MKPLAYALALLLLAASTAQAQLKVYDLEKGYYAIQDGKIVRVQVVTIDDDPVDPDPTPDDLTARAKAFKTAAAAVAEPKKEETAAALEMLYNQLAQAIQDNGLTDYQLIATLVKSAEKQVLDKQAATAAWKPVTGLTATELAKVAATSDVSAGDYAACLTDAADGVGAVTPANLDPVWLELIMQIIKILLDLLIN